MALPGRLLPSAGLSGFRTRFVHGLVVAASVSAYSLLMKNKRG
ncbi:MAG: hypothetical protein V1816_22480 [Pseudomonadota bacterium]